MADNHREAHTFSRIKLTPSRLPQFRAFHRNRRLVRYIWFCLELAEYDCPGCAPQYTILWDLGEDDNMLIARAFEDLFSILSEWQTGGELTLDISVYSPSDSQHGFKYLTFGPDATSENHDERRLEETPVLSSPCIGAGGPSLGPSPNAIGKVLVYIMSESPFHDDELAFHWWQQLPLEPIVTRVLLRQQTRRRWRPFTLTQMFTRMPRLQEVHYESWKEWLDVTQRWTDEEPQTLLEAPFLAQLRKLVLFENFNNAYPFSSMHCGCGFQRVASASIGQALAKASFNLESLSASFLVDAVDFFEEARGQGWKWPNLNSLALTSRLLRPEESSTKLDGMLRAAAMTALEIPNLETMELWGGQEKEAMLVRYRRARHRGPATLEWKGTWEMTLRDPVIKTWDAVALKDGGRACVIIEKLVRTATPIRSHGDALRLLGLSNTVIRPVSLGQILREDSYRAEIDDQ